MHAPKHTHTHLQHTPEDVSSGKPQRAFASVVAVKGWDQPLLFVFPVPASEVCVSVSICASLGL